MTSLILPVAGKSSRFVGTKPKWILTHPNGNPMFLEAVRGLDLVNVQNVYLVVLHSHVEEHLIDLGKINDLFYSKFPNWNGNFNIIELENSTKSQPETVIKAIEIGNIKGPIFVKDCDNFFEFKPDDMNAVVSYDVHDMELAHIRNKSFIAFDENNVVTNIVEKRVISSQFCVGGYSFADSQDFVRYFYSLENDENLYISHIIFKMILENRVFLNKESTNYLDFGTKKEWDNVKKSYSSFFVDIDGVLIKNSGEFCGPKWGDAPGIKENIDVINKLFNGGKTQIILTTSRKSEYKEKTIKQLEKEGIKYHQIIFDLPHAKRVIVNDYSNTNPYKSCDSINLKRDSADLANMIEDI